MTYRLPREVVVALPAIAAFVLSSTWGCGSGEEPGTTCSAEAVRTCTCADGAAGAQLCASTAAWAPCDCSAEPAAACRPGDVRACRCGSSAGKQFCGADHSWGACPCEVDADVAGDSLAGDAPTVRLEYHYVRIDDLGGQGGECYGGADIDAVILEKANDGSFWTATSVEWYEQGEPPLCDMEIDPLVALGEPDAFYAYPDVSVCDADPQKALSLGGLGGLLIVGMGASIDVGDQLTVLEVGGCEPDGGEAEDIEVFVSVGSELGGLWMAVGVGPGPAAKFVVPELPLVTVP